MDAYSRHLQAPEMTMFMFMKITVTCTSKILWNYQVTDWPVDMEDDDGRDESHGGDGVECKTYVLQADRVLSFVTPAEISY